MFFSKFTSRDKIDPRSILEDALSELASDEFVRAGLDFFDNHKLFTEIAAVKGSYEPIWLEDNREPSKAEIAFEVLFYTLVENGFLANIDWASDVEDIVEAFNILFRRRSLPAINLQEKTLLNIAAEGCKRDHVYLKLMPQLDNLAKCRDVYIGYFDMGWDAHLPIIHSKHIINKWEK